MKKGRIKKVLSVLLIILVLFGTVGCTESSEKEKSSSDVTIINDKDSEADTSEPITIGCFINHSWYWTDEWEGIIPEEITKRTGVKLDVTRALDSNQLGLMIASGDLPEMIFTSSELDRLSNDAVCYSYDELIEKYTPDWQPDSLRIGNAKKYSKDDDKYYTLIQNFNTEEEWKASKAVPMTSSLGYRGDIYEELGSPSLNTLGDLEKVLQMVKEKYPDMIPLAFDSNWKLSVFKIWTGVGESFKELEDGTIKHVINTPEYLDYLKLMNSWVRKGYMIPDNFTLSSADSKALAINDKAFAFSWCTQGDIYSLNDMIKSVDSDATYLECKPLTNEPYYVSEIGWSGTFITKNNNNPEASINFIKFLFSEEGQKLAQWGREGEEWNLKDNGTPEFSADWIEASKDSNVKYTKYNPAFFFGTSAVVESEGRIAFLPQEYQDVYEEIRDLMVVCPWMTYALPDNEDDEKVIYDKIEDMIKNTEVKIILSATPEEFEANYNEMVENAQKIGIVKLESFMTSNVKEAKKVYQ